MKKAKILIVGSGKIAYEHLKVLKNIKFYDVQGIFSRKIINAKTISKKFKIKNFSKDYKKLIHKIKPDAIFILVEVSNMYNVIKDIIKFKIPIFVEKPVGLSFKQCKHLESLCESFKVKNMVGLNRRFYSSFLKIKEIINKIGYPRQIIIEGHERIWNVKNKKKKILRKWHYANSIHTVDLLRYFCGEVKTVETFVQKKNFKEKNLASIIKFKNIIIGIYNTYWNSQDGWSIKLLSKDYTIFIKPLEHATVFFKNKKKQNINLDSFDKKYKTGFYLQALAFKNLLQRNEKKWPVQNLKDVLKTYSLIKKIFKDE